MIVEVTGPTGAGKTYCTKILVDELEKKFNVISIHQSTNIKSYLYNPNMYCWKTDIILLPNIIFFLIKHFKFSFLLMRQLYVLQDKLSNKWLIFRSVIRKMGLFFYFNAKKFSDKVIVIDEGLVHILHNIFVTSVSDRHDRKQIKNVLKYMPAIDYLVFLNQSIHVLKSNLEKRGDWSPRIRNKIELFNFIASARDLFVQISKNIKQPKYIINARLVSANDLSYIISFIDQKQNEIKNGL